MNNPLRRLACRKFGGVPRKQLIGEIEFRFYSVNKETSEGTKAQINFEKLELYVAEVRAQ
jgi:hypothetical protein